MTRTPTDEDYRWATQDFDPHPENNRVLHELRGKCWHIHEVCETPHPNYAADPRLVLEGMMEKGSILEFLSYANKSDFDDCGYIKADFVLDKTGRLRDLAIAFLKKEVK